MKLCLVRIYRRKISSLGLDMSRRSCCLVQARTHQQSHLKFLRNWIVAIKTSSLAMAVKTEDTLRLSEMQSGTIWISVMSNVPVWRRMTIRTKNDPYSSHKAGSRSTALTVLSKFLLLSDKDSSETVHGSSLIANWFKWNTTYQHQELSPPKTWHQLINNRILEDKRNAP